MKLVSILIIKSNFNTLSALYKRAFCKINTEACYLYIYIYIYMYGVIFECCLLLDTIPAENINAVNEAE